MTPPTPPHPFLAARLAMVEDQLRARDIRDPRVLEVMARLPRHLFLPPKLASRAYEDSALPAGEGQTISQPFIVACMTEQLRLEPQHHVLEIGTGTGYQTAVLAELVPNGHVYTIERVPALAHAARLRLTAYSNISYHIGDGSQGWPPIPPIPPPRIPPLPPSAPASPPPDLPASPTPTAPTPPAPASPDLPAPLSPLPSPLSPRPSPAPSPLSPCPSPVPSPLSPRFDRILITAGTPTHEPQPLLDQLAPSGIMIVPEGALGSQTLYSLTRTGPGPDDFLRKPILACRFVPLLGQYAWPER